MPVVDDDQLVKTLLTGGTHPAFRPGIGVRSTNRCMDHFDVLRSKSLIKGRRKLGIPIMEEVAKGWCSVFKRPTKLARLLCDLAGRWMLSATSDVDAARA